MALQPVPSCSMQPAESELYFLIARFLSKGPCAKSAQMLIQELNENNLLPNRLDWHGNEHTRTYEEMVSSNRTVTSDHLLRICQGLTRFVDKNAPVIVSKSSSLLGIANKPLCTEKGYRNTQWSHKTFATLQRGRPPEVPITRRPPNIVNVHHGKHLTGAVSFSSAFPVTMYQQTKMHKRILGHLSSVYCVAFDRTGQRIFTGSDDCLVKIWSALDGRLLATLRGHSAEISELTVNYENTLIAASSCEKIIRVWSLRTCAPMAVLQGHSGAVTSLLFSPLVKGSTRYLVSTGEDATVCLWQWDVDTLEFNDHPQKFIERSGPGSQMLCSSCSDGGMFLAVGGSDHAIRLYYFGNDVPEKVSELEGHNDIVDSILFSYNSERFVSGSKDGIARIWRLEEQEWQSIVLDMDTNLDDRQHSNDHTSYPKSKVLMIAWNTTDSYVVTASSAHLLKVWDSHTGKLLHVLMGHKNDIYVLEPHPFDSRMMLSAGHDGNIFIWDIKNGSKVTHYFNLIEGQGHGAILDCKLSADGQRIAGTDSHGYLLIFGFGNGKSYEKIPEQMFFHTDYRPLIVDGNQFVLDEQTQQAPHLMPPPFLVDVDGNPHPPTYQRLVPGRENCADEHLVPQLGYMETVDGEIVEQVVSQQTNSDQQNQDPNLRPDQRPNPEQEPGSSAQATNAARRDLASPPNIGLRRSGQVEGVRQMHNNAPRSQIATERDLLAWRKRVVVPEIPSVIYRKEEDIRIGKGEQERQFFANQKQRGLCDYSQEDNFRARNLRLRKKMASRMRPPRREVEEFLELSCEEDNGTRSSADEEEEEEEEEGEEIENQTDNTMQSASEDEDDWRNTSDVSSEYSDWTADAGINLQPPSRNSTRRRVQRLVSSSEDESSAGERSTEEKSTPKRVRPKKSTVDSETPRSAERVPLNREISSDWRPSNWITDTTPRRSPFVPQMGDEVIYFRQGHEAYINAVQRSNLRIGSSLKEPWKKCVLRDQELVKIVGIRYEIGPPTLCSLKLALIDHVSGKITEQSFSLKYHDMPDVIDFLVLRQFYDHARRTDWQAGDRFRSIIDDAWWFGMIVGQEPYQADYPDSLFQCYTVKWDNGEIEKLSPWDMEVIPDDVLPPEEAGASISITDEERDTLLYSPQEGEWGEGDQDSECERIICGIDQILNLDWTGPFSAPVDLSVYPSYCMMIAYPTDLATIRMRLVNRFYRRVSALMWEVRCIEHNARTFNEPGSNITKSAKRIADLLLKFIMDSNCCNITDLRTSPEGTSEDETCNLQNDNTTNSWKSRCMDLVDFLIDCEDSEPFREPVDLEQFPDYKDIIETPMDFGTIKETLAAEGYSSPYDLCNDMRLVFSNAKLYTPNKKSRIYGMVLRLSALMEERMKMIVFEYRAALKFQMSLADWISTKKVRGKDVQRGRLQWVSDRKLGEARPSTSDGTNQCFLEMSSPQPTSSGAACAPSPLSEASSSSGDPDGQSLCFSPASVTKSQASSRERDSSPSGSRSSGSETDSSSSTSTSEHSSSSSSSSSSERNNKTDSSSASHRVNGVKTKMTNGRQQRATALKQASQGNNQRRTASSKRRISSSSESDSESAGKTHQGTRKKMLRKCAALAANKIKNMSDVENSASTSDSDCSASKNSRTLPQRTAAEKAKRRLLDNSDEEAGLRSDSERERPAVKAPKSQSPECRVVLTNVCPNGTFGGRLLPQTGNGDLSDTESEPEPPCRKRQKKAASPPRVRKQRLISDSDSLFSSSSDSSPPRRANGDPPDPESSLSDDDSEDVRTNESVAGRSRGQDSKRKRILSSCDEDWQEKDSGRTRKPTRRSKIRTRNQGKRTVRYDENPPHSDENFNGAQSRASGLQRESHRERARQFFR